MLSYQFCYQTNAHSIEESLTKNKQNDPYQSIQAINFSVSTKIIIFKYKMNKNNMKDNK